MVKRFTFEGKKYRIGQKTDLSKSLLSKEKKNIVGLPLRSYSQDTISTRAYKDKSRRRKYLKYQSKGGKKSFTDWLWGDLR